MPHKNQFNKDRGSLLRPMGLCLTGQLVTCLISKFQRIVVFCWAVSPKLGILAYPNHTASLSVSICTFLMLCT